MGLDVAEEPDGPMPGEPDLQLARCSYPDYHVGLVRVNTQILRYTPFGAVYKAPRSLRLNPRFTRAFWFIDGRLRWRPDAQLPYLKKIVVPSNTFVDFGRSRGTKATSGDATPPQAMQPVTTYTVSGPEEAAVRYQEFKDVLNFEMVFRGAVMTGTIPVEVYRIIRDYVCPHVPDLKGPLPSCREYAVQQHIDY